MMPTASSSCSEWIFVGVCWLNQHGALSTFLVFLPTIALSYWHFVLRAYVCAGRSKADRQRIISPVMLGPLGNSFRWLPAPGLREDVEFAPFGQWLMPHMELRGMTVSQLAGQLGQHVAAVHAVIYGVPVGSRLPSPALVDAICASLELDSAEGRAAYFAIANDTQPGSRSA